MSTSRFRFVFASGGAAAISALLIGVTAAPSARAADPVSFASASGHCNHGDSRNPYSRVSFPTQTAAHLGVAIKLTSGSGSGDFYFGPDPNTVGNGGAASDFGGADITWADADPIVAGSTPYVNVFCASAPIDFNFTAELFEVPATPTSFSGVTTYNNDGKAGGNVGSFSGASTIYFTAPARAPYDAELTLSQGSVRLDGETGKRTFVSSGSYPLGSLSPGIHSLTLSALDGAPAHWSISIHAQPIKVSAASFDRPAFRPGAIAVASYQLSGDATLGASINDASGHTVRQLANGAEMRSGEHTIRWDGFDELGRPVADGEYTLTISALDSAGQTSTATAAVALDGHGPTAQIVSPRVLPAQQAIAVRISDPTSGVARAKLLIDREEAAALPIGQSTLTYRPKTGWLRPSYEIEIVATDHAGNLTATSQVQHIHLPSQTIALDRGLGPWKLAMVRTTRLGLIRTMRRPSQGDHGFGGATLVDYYEGLRLSWNTSTTGQPVLTEVATTRPGDRDSHGLRVGAATLRQARMIYPHARFEPTPDRAQALGATLLEVWRQGYEAYGYFDLWFNRAGTLVGLATGYGGAYQPRPNVIE